MGEIEVFIRNKTSDKTYKHFVEFERKLLTKVLSRNKERKFKLDTEVYTSTKVYSNPRRKIRVQC